MNHSVAMMVPKTKIYKSILLLTRVMLCDGAQIARHQQLQEQICDYFYLNLDQNLFHHLTKLDLNKIKRQVLQCTQKYKASRSNKQYLEYVEAHADQLEENKSGVKYEIGIAVKVAKTVLKSTLKKKSAWYLTCWLEVPFFIQSAA